VTVVASPRPDPGWSYFDDGSGLTRGEKPVTDWPSVREYVLERDGRLCQICRFTIASDVDHIWPRRLGGRDHIGNLRAACGPCNKSKSDRVNLVLASTQELALGLDAISGRIEKEVTEFESLAMRLALSNNLGALLTATVRVHQVQRELECLSTMLAAKAEHLRAYEDSPTADILAFPGHLDEVVALTADDRVRRGAMTFVDWVSRVAYLCGERHPSAARENDRFTALVPYFRDGAATTDEATAALERAQQIEAARKPVSA
jgi:HNH endonuclease